ncbi:MAG: AtpZ/AtpI family protein [Planctomycetes bacterium]|nr:AtpZ/AtpI family protein [Planctomycetota bacterium]MCB9910837.1 AtpZ/AtpI family protein [Planctomycetota bacterium]MCB9912231.1 AtpZ/AtpI family protein [Planctomycetota bacterium]HPF13148.1 AtpZ/AtpI family protein [Planctomycetota bacterium]HRV80739.1 AtpZ/AtpI family protein [Planctomycetota bacterium]
MSDPTKPAPESDRGLAREVGMRAERKIHARKNPHPGIWLGLGMMGLIGWSVSIPTLVGAAIGIWLDKHYPGGRSWTLALLVAGLTLGCFQAWLWVRREEESMKAEREDPDA